MSIEQFFDHKCDIYHIVEGKASPGFNLPPAPTFSYPDTPDLPGVSCHFSVKNFNYSVTQQQPVNEYETNLKLTLPIGTDIRLNDKIVSRQTGYEYTAEMPRNVRNHHLFVRITRVDAQKPL